MSTNPEVVPTQWSTSDESFFRLVGSAFGADFLAGASVLLASYDSEVDEAAAPLAAPVAVAPRQPATTDEGALR